MAGISEHPHEESNLDPGVRSAVLCPLSYRGLVTDPGLEPGLPR